MSSLNTPRIQVFGTVFAVLIATVGLSTGPAAAATPDTAIADTGATSVATTVAAKDGETKNVAFVKVELRQESGKVVTNEGTVDWDSSTNLEIKADDVVHALDLKVVRESSKASNASVTLAYSRGDQAVIAPYTFDVKLKKREVIRIEGGLAIAVTVVAKTVAVDAEEGAPKGPKVETIDGDDPLSGL